MILSEIMLAELLYINSNTLRLSATRKLHQSTLKALLNRKLVHRIGQRIECTSLGYEVASRKKLNKRLHEADVADSVKALLHVSKILPFRKVA